MKSIIVTTTEGAVKTIDDVDHVMIQDGSLVIMDDKDRVAGCYAPGQWVSFVRKTNLEITPVPTEQVLDMLTDAHRLYDSLRKSLGFEEVARPVAVE